MREHKGRVDNKSSRNLSHSEYSAVNFNCNLDKRNYILEFHAEGIKGLIWYILNRAIKHYKLQSPITVKGYCTSYLLIHQVSEYCTEYQINMRLSDTNKIVLILH